MKLIRFRHFMGWFGMALLTFAAVLWWGWALPIVRGAVPAWAPQFSAQGFWEAKQEALRAGLWLHDDGWIAGQFGNKEWAERIIRKISEGRPYRGCENGHQEGILEDLTNHSVQPENGKISEKEEEEAWLAWWRENSSKTQEEWIRDGFAEAGFAISLPPSKEDWPLLLRVLGACAGPNPRPSGRPAPLYGNLQYNAYRWLRDSGFDPMTFVLEKDAGSLDGDTRGGLKEYGVQEKYTRMARPAGRLSFSDQSDIEDYMGLQLKMIGLAKPRSLDAIGASICGVALAAALVLLFLRRQPRVVTAATT